MEQAFDGSFPAALLLSDLQLLAGKRQLLGIHTQSRRQVFPDADAVDRQVVGATLERADFVRKLLVALAAGDELDAFVDSCTVQALFVRINLRAARIG